ncbi:hypothetical protein CNYM01_03073 [Colletotrichum nymphaeae SA-01]|uniref:Uncharacterized protein n=1 Tax=Colletotrichum nymphaeae SA-01 TaxID=1460502 RepID=A0A135T5G8_9PEZI|nr:hypothetical protein CNYM01_03073 [Colletotrichum nymphaeae SA-01]
MTRNLAKPTIKSPGFLVCRMPAECIHSYTNKHQPLTPSTIHLPRLPTKTQSPPIHTKPTNSTTMAAFTLLFTPATAVYGRSGYNKDGDDEEKNDRGRSGYNKDGDDDDEGQNKGRSGYNKDGDDEEDK